jgi:DNA polymerase-4
MIACVAVSYFAAAVERRADDALQRQPLAIGGQAWEARPAYAFSEEVASQGVRSGMSLRSVQVLSPHSHFLPATKPHYSQVSAEMIDVLADFSPLIEAEELWHTFAESEWRWTAHGRALPARYCLDLDGLPPSEAVAFVQEMGRQVRQETSFAPAIGLAVDRFTAQVAAVVCRPNRLLPVAAGDTAQFLSRRPIHFLPLEKETARRLELLGIRTLGQFGELPLHGLRERFGRDIERLYRLAQGQAGEPLQSQPAEPYQAIERQFDEPITNLQVLTAVLSGMVEEVSQDLQREGLEGHSLHLILETDGGQCQEQQLTLSRPTAGAEHIRSAVLECLATLTFSSGITWIKVRISELAPATAYQLSLFREAAVSSVSSPIEHTMQNLAAKYKSAHFFQPVLTERSHPLPERRFTLQALTYDPALA